MNGSGSTQVPYGIFHQKILDRNEILLGHDMVVSEQGGAVKKGKNEEEPWLTSPSP